MPTNNLAPKAKNKLGIASSIPPNMAERFGAAVSPYLQGAQALFPPANPYGQVVSNFLLGQAPQAAQQMAAGYPNVLFNTSNPLGSNRIVNPVALDMALALPVATAVKGAGMAGGGVAATFAGARAQTANHAALALAEEMKALGTPDEEIYRATGWFFGSADGKPRFEIDDSGAKGREYQLTPQKAYEQARVNAFIEDSQLLRDRANSMTPYSGMSRNQLTDKYLSTRSEIIDAELNGDKDLAMKLNSDRSGLRSLLGEMRNAKYGPLSGYMKHGELGKAYPDVYGLHTRIAPDDLNVGTRGQYMQGSPRMGEQFILKEKPNSSDPISVALHESQHAIQQREGFARGGSPEGLPEALGNDAKALRTKANQLLAQGNRPEALALEKQARQLDSQIVWGNHAPQELYRRLAGEAEARLTQSRMDMTGPERAASYPPGMYDVPVGDQIVRYGEGPALATVYHGSPHKFAPTELNDLGEFNAAKINTGEGAQAYGHGHYTAESQGVARGYKDKLQGGILGEKTASFLSSRLLKSNPDLLSTAIKPQVLDTISASAGKSPAEMSSALNRLADSFERQGFDWQLAAAPNVRKLAKDKHLLSDVSDNIAGSLYKVDIPDEHIAKMLDWDKPLSQQTPNVQKALSPLLDAIELDKRSLMTAFSKPDLDREMIAWRKGLTGEDVLQTVEQYIGQKSGTAGRYEQEASKALSDLGIPGVRYLDAGSRGAGGGTSNFVVFPGNENMMTILERNGQAMSPESQAIARYREVKGPKSVVRMEAALRTAGVPLPKNEPVAYIRRLVDQAHRRN